MKKSIKIVSMCVIMMMVMIAGGCKKSSSFEKPVDMGLNSKEQAAESTTEEKDPNKATMGWADSIRLVASVLNNEASKVDVQDSQQASEDIVTYVYDNAKSDDGSPVYEFTEVTKVAGTENILRMTDVNQQIWEVRFSIEDGKVIPESVEPVAK